MNTEDLTSGFVYVPELSVSKRISSQSLAVEVPLAPAVAFEETMADAVMPDFSLDSAAQEMETVNSLLNQASLRTECVCSMD